MRLLARHHGAFGASLPQSHALREGRLAGKQKHEAKGAVDGPIMEAFLALIYARVGELDLAFPLLERLLQTTGAVDSDVYSITRSDLAKRSEWTPLRADPRFAQLFGAGTPSPVPAR